MNEKFLDLRREKQDKIINGALKIFALDEYKRASTQAIVGEAGISKGLLFHYFENKLNLYEFLFNYTVRYYAMELSGCVSQGDRDPFEFYRKKIKAEVNIMKTYPFMTVFLHKALKEKDAEVVLIQEEGRATLDRIEGDYRNQLNFGLIKKVEEDMLIELMELVMDGVRNDTAGNPEVFEEKARQYLDALKGMNQ